MTGERKKVSGRSRRFHRRRECARRSIVALGRKRTGPRSSREGLRRDGPTRDAARSGACLGIRRRRVGRARAQHKNRGDTARDAHANRARSRAVAPRALPRGSGGGEKHIRRRGASERGEATLGGADRAAPVTRIGRAGDAPELRHGERSVCAETTVCAFARGRRTARRPLITCRTIDGLRCLVDKDTGDSEKTRV